MSRALFTALALSLAITLILEAGFFLIATKRNKKDLILLVLVNVLTNPVVVLLYWLVVWYTNWNARIILTLFELLVILTEGFYYKKYGCGFRWPFLFSIAANMFSFLTGMLIQQLI